MDRHMAYGPYGLQPAEKASYRVGQDKEREGGIAGPYPGAGAYWSSERAQSVGFGTLATVGGAAGLFVLGAATAPASAAGALVFAVSVVGTSASFSLGTAQLMQSLTAEHVADAGREMSTASGFIEPGSLAAKIIDQVADAGGKIEKGYELGKAVIDIGKLSEDRTTLEESLKVIAEAVAG